ncbi:MAG: GDSL-type esterase/lipase family protein [Oscillospiraceae bacterium]
MAVPRYAKKKSKLPPMFYILGSLVVLVVILVIMFISFVIKDKKEQNKSPSLPSKPVSDTGSSSTGNSSTDSKSSSTEPPSSSSSSVSASVIVSSKPDAAPMSYLDDALLIGDSISVGFSAYGALPTANVLASRNVSLDKIHLNKKVYSTPQGDLTLNEALAGKSPKKIYILLGSNGIPGLENTLHIKYYEEMLKNIRDKFPDAIIYTQSVTPVTAKCEQDRPVMNNAKINEFNALIKELSPKYNAYYLDISTVLKDSSGTLNTDFAEKDGIHFKAATYQVILNYYLANAK